MLQQQLQQQQTEQQQHQSQVLSAAAKNTSGSQAADLEDISDGEENLTGDEVPPPAPKFKQQQQEQQSSSSAAAAAAANAQRCMLNSQSPLVLVNQATDAACAESVVSSTSEERSTIAIDELLLPPGRQLRAKRICIIIRGPPGSGKSHVARLIKDKELEMGGANARILSIDDYFIIENEYEEKCPKTGKKIPKKEILYEYDENMEETYMQYLLKSFRKTLSDHLYDVIIVDCNNNTLRTLNEFHSSAIEANFAPYVIDLHCDVETCLGRNSHQRSEAEIRAVLEDWAETPPHFRKLDVSTLLENVVEMEDVENMATDDNANTEEQTQESSVDEPQAVAAAAVAAAAAAAAASAALVHEDEDSNSADAANNCGFLKSKWENDTTEDNLARLDGTKRLLLHKRNSAATSMEEFLQLDDWQPPTINAADGKKRVRWADIEEKRAQQKMRAIGFVVGQTDWKRMMDPNAGNRALNKTKYIERVNKRR